MNQAVSTPDSYVAVQSSFIHYFYEICPESFDVSLVETLKERSGKTSLKRAIRHWIARNENTAPFDFDTLTPEHIMTFLAGQGNSAVTSVNTLNTKKSSLMQLFRRYNHNFPASFDATLKSLISDFKKALKEASEPAESKTKKGIMGMEEYRLIMEDLYRQGTSRAVFALCYLSLTWNLMSKTTHTATISIHDLQWSNDSLAVHFSHDDKYSTGPEEGQVRHLFANPYEPFICPVTAVGTYLASLSIRTGPLFEGSSQHVRFHNIINEVVNRLRPIHRYLFEFDHTTDSFRKGAWSYSCNGVLGGPSFASMCQRADRDMGVEHRFPFFSPCQDQFLGRVLCGLDLNSPKFGVLPPMLNQAGMRLIESRFCGPYNEDAKMKRVYTMVLCSLIHHGDYFDKELTSGHPLFHSVFFLSGEWTHLKESLLKSNDDYDIRPTGLGPYTAILMETEKSRRTYEDLIRRLDNIPEKTMQLIIEALEKRGILTRRTTTQESIEKATVTTQTSAFRSSNK